MAVTKIKAIRGTLNKALAYIMNPEKTDDKMLVSSYGCAAETAAQEFEWTRKIAEQQGMNPVKIIARHVIQSFDVGEVSPELAHEIGKQFADEILGGKYEYVLTTHIDKGHVHKLFYKGLSVYGTKPTIKSRLSRLQEEYSGKRKAERKNLWNDL